MDLNKLVEEAIKARDNAYAPYSKFKVGAAILLNNGKYILGCNVENVSYGLTNCAERTALFKMISEGYDKDDVLSMAIVADTTLPVTPCGACRQVMCELLNPNTVVVLSNLNKDIKETTVSELMPFAFEEIENAD